MPAAQPTFWKVSQGSRQVDKQSKVEKIAPQINESQEKCQKMCPKKVQKVSKKGHKKISQTKSPEHN